MLVEIPEERPPVAVMTSLSKLVERGDVNTGALTLLLGFGGGLSYAGQVIRCP